MSSTVADNNGGSRERSFLSAGGEMGSRIRAHDWSKGPLGSPDRWPQSLRSVVSMLLASKAQIILFWGPDFITLYNDAYRPVFGGKHPRVLGLPGRESWSEVWEGSGLRALLEGVAATGEAFAANDRLFVLERFGYTEETYFDVSYDPVRDESGGVGGVFCIVTETTLRVIGERRLKALRALAASTAEATSVRSACRAAVEILAEYRHDLPFVAIYLLDAEGKSAHLCGSSGVEERSHITPSRIDVSGVDGGGWPLAAVLASRRSETVTDLGQRFGTLPGSVWPEPMHSAVVLPLGKSGQDRVAGFLIAGVSPRRALDEAYRDYLDLVGAHVSTAIANAQAYEEEKRRAEALADLDRAKTAFFSNVSHEFRTPLTLMLGPLEDALANVHGILPSGASQDLSISHRNALRLLKLVNTLLDFSRIEAGRIEANYEPTDVATLTSDLASNFRSACEKAGLRLTVDCQALRGADPVYVDRDMWEKIVLNLVGNAFKFTMKGQIEVRLDAAGEHLRLTVRDTGVGIPPEELPHMFERFHRVKGTRGRTHEGTGIGLAFVQELVKLHGGTVHVESSLGVGSTFTVTVPFGAGHLDQQRIGRPASLTPTGIVPSAFIEESLGRPLGDCAGEAKNRIDSRVQRERAPSSAHAWDPKPLVLVADDNADMRQYIVRLLSDQYRVHAVADGREAMESVETELPELILTDVMMPRLDGIGLLQELRENSRTRSIPVIMLSARAGEESKVEGIEAGADDYIVKPFSAREVLASVDAHIKMARLRREAAAELREREERFRAFLTASSDAVYRMSSDWTEMRHLQGKEFIADTTEPSRGWLQKYIHPEDQARVLSAIDHAIATKTVFELEHRVLRPDGTLAWTYSRAVPILDEQGEIVEWFGAASDVTVRRQVERTIRHHAEQFETLLNRAPLGVYLVDADFRIRNVNPIAQTVFEQIEGGVEGRDFDEIIHALCAQEYADELVRIFRHTLETGEPYVVSERAEVRSDRGIVEYYEWRVDRITVPDGRFGVVCYFRDISQQVRARLALAESKEQIERQRRLYEAILTNTPDLAYIFDLNHRFIYANKVLLEMWGRTWEQAIGRTCLELGYEPWHAEMHDREIEQVIATKKPIRGEVPFDGTFGRRIYDYIFVPVLDNEGRVEAIAGTTRDITDRKRAEEQLEHAVAERTSELEQSHRQLRLTERMASLGTLAAGLGHDMGNLLVPVRVSLESIEALNLPERAVQDVAGIRGAVNYLQKLASGLRLLAVDPNLDRGGEATEAHAWWAEASGVLKNCLPRRVLLEVTLPESDCWIAMPKAAVMQSVFNLVQNAGYAMRGQQSGVVLVDVKCDADKVALTVSDNGPGMTEEVQRRCMEPFFSTKTRDISTGLGLTLVYGLVQRWGGAVELKSTVGKGTAFTLTFKPVAAPAEQAAGGGRLAVLDIKDPRMRAIVTTELRALRFDVQTGANGAQDAELVVTDQNTAHPEGRGKTIVLGENGGSSNSVVALGAKPTVQAIRDALRKAAEGNGDAPAPARKPA